jgi:vacuolar-type H+-ATPase subunit H
MLSGSVNEMERKEILEKLKTTEAEIRENVEAAQHKRNEILASAQKQARKLEDDGERRIKT